MKSLSDNIIKVVVGGPYHSGKTTTIHSLDPNAKSADRLQPDGQTTTVGFDLGRVVWVKSQNDREEILPFHQYDAQQEAFNGSEVKEIALFGAAGQMRFSAVRKATLQGAKGVLFIVDSTKSGHVGHCVALFEEIKLILGNNVPMIVLANKQDLEDAMTPAEIKSLLDIHDMVVIPSSAINGEGIKEALLQLLKSIAM